MDNTCVSCKLRESQRLCRQCHNAECESISAALRAALERMLASTKRVIESNIDSDIWYNVTRAQEMARAAIALARGESNG